MATQFVDPCLLLIRYRLSYVKGPGDCLGLVIYLIDIVILLAWPSTASNEEVISTASLQWATQIILGIIYHCTPSLAPSEPDSHLISPLQKTLTQGRAVVQPLKSCRLFGLGL